MGNVHRTQVKQYVDASADHTLRLIKHTDVNTLTNMISQKCENCDPQDTHMLEKRLLDADKGESMHGTDRRRYMSTTVDHHQKIVNEAVTVHFKRIFSTFVRDMRTYKAGMSLWRWIRMKLLFILEWDPKSAERVMDFLPLVNECELRFNTFVANVLQHGFFAPISGGKPVKLGTIGRDWSDAVINAKRILTMFESGFEVAFYKRSTPELLTIG